MRAIILAIGLISMPAAAQTAKDEAEIVSDWRQMGDTFSAAGITRPMYRQFHYWLTGQNILGQCSPYIPESDSLSWRTWWKNTPLEQTDVGRHLLLIGANSYNDGVAERLKAPTPRDVCVGVTKKWAAEMKRIIAEKSP